MLYLKDVGHISHFLKEVYLFSGLAEIAKVELHICRVGCGIIMNRYRYASALSDNIRRAAHNDPSWKGAEV